MLTFYLDPGPGYENPKVDLLVGFIQGSGQP